MEEQVITQEMLEVDKLKLYLGFDYKINDYITVKQPTVGNIALFGEKKYYNMVYGLCSIPSDMKSQLWDMGIDWNDISDFELFILLTRQMGVDQTKLILGDKLDLSKFEIGTGKSTGLPLLYCRIDTLFPKEEQGNKKNGLLSKMRKKPNNQDNIISETMDDYIIIDELVYERMVMQIRAMHNIKVKVEHAANKFTKMALIEEDRQRIQINQIKKQKNNGDDSILLPLVSAMVNSAEFKYNAQELVNIGIYQFMDSVQRIQLIRSSDALLKGIYGGMLDVKSLNKEDLNWLKALS